MDFSYVTFTTRDGRGVESVVELGSTLQMALDAAGLEGHTVPGVNADTYQLFEAKVGFNLYEPELEVAPAEPEPVLAQEVPGLEEFETEVEFNEGDIDVFDVADEIEPEFKIGDWVWSTQFSLPVRVTGYNADDATYEVSYDWVDDVTGSIEVKSSIRPHCLCELTDELIKRRRDELNQVLALLDRPSFKEVEDSGSARLNYLAVLEELAAQGRPSAVSAFSRNAVGKTMPEVRTIALSYNIRIA